jgi:hypothetical protein
MIREKRGVVLFATLLFIIALSILIVKNLAITDGFINTTAKNSNIKQLELSIKDINGEILKLFKDKDSGILNDFPPTIPFSYGNIDVELSLEPYSQKTYKLDKNFSSKFDGDLSYYVNKNALLEVIGDKNITNQKQVDFIIDEYIYKTNDYRILEIEDRLTYLDLNQTNYISCKYALDIDGLRADVEMIFEPNKNKVKPEKLEIIIKR